MTKSELRHYIKSIIKSIENKDEKSLIICNRLYPLLKKYNVVGLYMATDDEVNLDQLILKLLEDRKTVCVPKIHGEKIVFTKLVNLEDTVTSHYGIRETVNEIVIDKKDIDIFIIPGLAFDSSGNRLGHGKGYYDMYLKNVNKEIVGVCFREQVVDEIPVEIFDKKINKLIYI